MVTVPNFIIWPNCPIRKLLVYQMLVVLIEWDVNIDWILPSLRPDARPEALFGAALREDVPGFSTALGELKVKMGRSWEDHGISLDLFTFHIIYNSYTSNNLHMMSRDNGKIWLKTKISDALVQDQHGTP